MRYKILLANIALLVISLISAIAFGEIVVRILYKDVTTLFPRYHTDYHYGRYTIRGIRSNAEFWHTSPDGSWKFVTNSKGFRNTKEFAYEKPAGTMRVLSLGDSHTQGYEVRQDFTFSAILERYLTAHKISAEVINTGVSGFGNAEQLVLLENEGYKYHPDVVVLAFYANDFEDNIKSDLFGLTDGNQLVEKKFEHIPGVNIQNLIYSLPAVKWLSENSYLYSTLFNTTWVYFKKRLKEHAVQQTSGSRKPLAESDGDLEFAIPTSANHSDYETSLAAALIERMQQFCAKKGIRFMVVDIPNRLANHRFASSLSSVLREKLDAANIEYISSETYLQDFDGIAEIHVPHGSRHISEFTHTLVGAEIGRRILTESQ